MTRGMTRGQPALLRFAMTAVAAVGLTFFKLTPSLAAEPVDLELVIATDVSRSIDVSEARLQREGVASALRNPAVIEAIQGGYHRKIAVAYIDYSNRMETVVVVNWRIIDSKASAEAFAEFRPPHLDQRGHRVRRADDRGKRFSGFAPGDRCLR